MSEQNFIDASNGAELDDRGLRWTLGYAVTRVEIATRKVFHEHLGTPLGLRPVEFSVLLLLLGNEDVMPKQLCRTLSVHAPAMTLVLDRLEESALVQRERSKPDRRSQHIRLTRKGRELAQQALAISKTMEDDLLNHLSVAERAMLLELLHKVVARLPEGE